MHDLISRIAQLPVTLQLISGRTGVLVFQRTVSLADGAVLRPVEVGPSDTRTLLISDPYLQVGRRKLTLTHDHPGQ
jgi:hypothetical protein